MSAPLQISLERLQAELAQALERTRATESRLEDLKEKYVKSTVATEYLITTLSDRFDRHERHFSQDLVQSVTSIQEEVTRLKALDEERARQETTGRQNLAEIKASQHGQSALKASLENNKGLIQLLLTLAAAGAAVAQWFINK